MCGEVHNHKVVLGNHGKFALVERWTSHRIFRVMLQASCCPLGVSMRWRFERAPFGQLR